MKLQEQIQRIQEMMGINPDNERKYIDWDENYGKTFKIVKTPEGRQSVGEWNPNLISIVTPENTDAWTDWEEYVDKQEIGDCQTIVSFITRSFPEAEKVFGEIEVDEPYMEKYTLIVLKKQNNEPKTNNKKNTEGRNNQIG